MIRCKVLAILFMIIFIRLEGEQVYIAPLLSVDEGEESYEADTKLQDDICESLEEQKEFLGVEIIKTGKKIKQVRSSYDALKLCREEKIKYLIYGWIKKSEYTYEGELRIFDGEGRKNIFTVYEKEGVENYEKFIKNISKKVLESLHEIFYIPKQEEVEKYSRINVGPDIWYWTFMNKSWVKYMSGTIGVGGSFEIIPDDSVFFIKTYPVYFSVGLSLDYRLAVNRKEAVKSYLNNINAVGYTNMYINFYDIHRVYGKAGVLYALDILQYQDKYSDGKVNTSGAVGLIIGFGYKYSVSEKIKIIFANEAEFVFYKKVMSKYLGKVGVEFEVFKKEYKRK